MANGIDWGQLKNPQQQGGVIAQLPQQPNQFNQLAGGAISGIAQGQEMQQRSQQMDQAKQLFPSQLQNTQNKAGISSIELQNAQDQRAASVKLRAVMQQGEGQYIDTLQKTDPLAAQAYLKSKQDLTKATADAAGAVSDSRSKAAASADQITLGQGHAASQAHQVEQTVYANTKAQLVQQAQAQAKANPNQPPPDANQIEQQAKQAGQEAGQKVFSMKVADLGPYTQQAMQKVGLDKWNDNTNMLLQTSAGMLIADKQEQAETAAATPEMKNANSIAITQQRLQDGTSKNPQVDATRLQVLQAQVYSKDQNSSLMLSKDGQKAFQVNSDMMAKVDSSLNDLRMTQGQLNSIPKDAINPVTGDLYGKYQAQGETIKAGIHKLVLGAPALLGLPASSLRIASIWPMIESTKPALNQWMPAAKAITASLQYSGALQQESIWKQQAEQMQALKDRGNPAGIKEADGWFSRHPEPTKVNPKPDLEPMYKQFPQLRQMNLEKDWEDAAKAGTSKVGGQQDQGNQQQPQQGQPQQGQQQGQSANLTFNPQTGKLE